MISETSISSFFSETGVLWFDSRGRNTHLIIIYVIKLSYESSQILQATHMLVPWLPPRIYNNIPITEFGSVGPITQKRQITGLRSIRFIPIAKNVVSTRPTELVKAFHWTADANYESLRRSFALRHSLTLNCEVWPWE